MLDFNLQDAATKTFAQFNQLASAYQAQEAIQSQLNILAELKTKLAAIDAREKAEKAALLNG